MKYRLNEENYIEDFASGNDTDVFEMQKELNYFMLPNCEYAYQIVDDKLIETPFDWEAYNQEQLAKQRDAKIVSAIREIYSIDDEYKLINLGIANNQDPEYLEYRKTVNDIKSKII